MPTPSLMIDIANPHLTAEDRSLIQHPAVGGIILFTRNYINCNQLIDLTHAIRQLRNQPFIIAVDHEGGRVQRFREGFSAIPPMRELGNLYAQQPAQALQTTEALGWQIGSELRTVGIDYVFAPVLDIDHGTSTVIGDRAFHHTPDIISTLAQALVRGFHRAGLRAVGKHFPGHGYVREDSHIAMPVDDRNLAQLDQCDLLPFKALIQVGIDGMMPAHVIYPKMDHLPAGFSTFWLQTVLRQQLGFEGLIFSDDLCMMGAEGVGDIHQRVHYAKNAGCDFLLVCNRRDLVKEILNDYA